MPRCNLILVWLTLVAALCGAAASANLVLNPGFETGDFTNWTVPGDGIVIDMIFPNAGCRDAAFQRLDAKQRERLWQRIRCTKTGRPDLTVDEAILNALEDAQPVTSMTLQSAF